ncbi:MAG: tryptophan synthase subunit alpha [Chloroflexi bacterium]|nr:tryptophan synthase subunit alpha [Chloroflexota bacterium]
MMGVATTDRLGELFARTRAEGRTALIGFVPGCWPELDASVAIAEAAEAGGMDALELGIPFSDPLADGVTNQAAYQQALAAGATPAAVLGQAAAIRAAGVRMPLLLMGYCNTLLAYGLERFVRDAAAAGVDGLVVVDLPPEEASKLERVAQAAGVHVVYLLAPTSTAERIALVARHASGFIYCVSVTGVTGARAAVAEGLPEFVARVRAQTALPLAVGFGISTRAQVTAVGALADAVIVGSALVQAVAGAPRAERAAAVRAFTAELCGRSSSRSGGGGD